MSFDQGGIAESVKTREPPRKSSPEYSSEDADVDLISRDNVLFKVHSYRLQYASSVFRSMISMAGSTAQKDSITLTDERIENSQVVKKALDIIYTLNIDTQAITSAANLLLYVIDFAKKWEMGMITEMIRKEMARRIDSKTELKSGSFDHFRICLALGDNKLAAEYYGSQSPAEFFDTPFMGSNFGDFVEEEPEYDTYNLENVSESGDSDASSDEAELSQLSDTKRRTQRYGDSKRLPDYYLNDDTSKGLLTDDLYREGFIFDLSVVPYRHFLHLRPTVIWVLLRAQRMQREQGGLPKDHVRKLLDIACRSHFGPRSSILRSDPPSNPGRSNKKRKAEDWLS